MPNVALEPAPGSNAWLMAQIERSSPPDRRAKRQHLYRDLAPFGANDERAILIAIYHAQRISRVERGCRSNAMWYAKERARVERLLAEIHESDVLSCGPDISDFVFYEPWEVDCPHGRRAKRCTVIRQKVEALRALRSSRRRTLLKRLRGEIATLAVGGPPVNPDTARPDDFCAPRLADPIDGRARAGEGALAPGGRPPDSVGNYLLEVIGTLWRQHGRPLRDACTLVARILWCCHGRDDISAVKEEEVIERLLRRERHLRLLPPPHEPTPEAHSPEVPLRCEPTAR